MHRGEQHIQSRGFSLVGSTISVSSANSSCHCGQHPDGCLLYPGRHLGAVSKAKHMALMLDPLVHTWHQPRRLSWMCFKAPVHDEVGDLPSSTPILVSLLSTMADTDE